LKNLRQYFVIAVSVALGLALAACAGTSGTPSTPWTDAQTAYVELTSYQAAQAAALAVAQSPGLSAKAVAEISASEEIATAAIMAQAQALASGGSAGAQATAAIISAAGNSVSAIVREVGAQHGTTNVDAEALGVAGGIAALSSAPAIITAIDKVGAGYQPTTADLVALVRVIEQTHQQMRQLGQPGA